MTSLAQLRKAALALPEVTEGTHFHMPSFSVAGKGFASLAKDDCLQVQLSEADAEEFLATHPSAERVVRMGTPIGVRIPLADISGKDLNALVRASWHRRAPARLRSRVDREPDGGDLPAIGKPAMRALHEAGVVTLDQVAASGRAALLELHGVGPKAIRILDEALDAHGLTWRA